MFLQYITLLLAQQFGMLNGYDEQKCFDVWEIVVASRKNCVLGSVSQNILNGNFRLLSILTIILSYNPCLY